MYLKTALTAVALMLAPGLAMADCAWHEKTASVTCADGTTYDAETRTCVSTTS